MAVCQEMGVTNSLIPRIAGPFAGGMGGTGEVCGAVVGGLMSIGVKHGRDDVTQSDELGRVLAQRFLKGFREEMGNIYCRELTEGADLTTQEGREKFRASDIPMRVCLRAGGVAYDLALRLVKEPKLE